MIKREEEIIRDALPMISALETEVETEYQVLNGRIDIISASTVWEAKAYRPHTMATITRVAAQSTNYNLFAGRDRIGLVFPSVQWDTIGKSLFLRVYPNCVVLETELRRITACIPQWHNWCTCVDEATVKEDLRGWCGPSTLPPALEGKRSIALKQTKTRDKYEKPLRFLVEHGLDVASTGEFVGMCLDIDGAEVETLVRRNRNSLDRPPHKVAGFILRAIWGIRCEWVEDRQRNRVRGERSLRRHPNFAPCSDWVVDHLTDPDRLISRLSEAGV